MAILDTIMSTPVDIASLGDTASLERKLDAAFSNLLYFAKSNWSYRASGDTGGEDLMAGTAHQAPCGGIATALKLVFMRGLDVPEGDIEYIRLTGYLWTGPEYLCFDPKVTGNLRNLKGRDYRNGCIFNEHYYLCCNNKYYDPCLSTSYIVRDQSVKERFQGKLNMGVGTNRKLLYTPDRQTGFIRMPEENVPGFNGAWVKFPLNKKNIQSALGSRFFKTEMAYRRGDTTFAQFVNSLN